VNAAAIDRADATPGVADLLRDFSLEITGRDVDRLSAAGDQLPAGTRVSITFLPGDDVGRLADVASRVRSLGLAPVPHISARRIQSGDELRRFLRALQTSAAIDKAFVVAGDASRALGPYDDALAIIRTGLFAEYGVRTVGVAGYPEGHPQIGVASLSRALLDKRTALSSQGLATEVITQFAFDAAPVAAWVRRLRSEGFAEQIRIGVAGPTSVQALIRFAARCGVGASTRILSKYGVSITRLLATATPDRFLQDLLNGLGADASTVRVHFYPFGGVDKVAAWAAQAGGEDAR
jgi:methylenetetrahydrofolate reductase (NADPH)